MLNSLIKENELYLTTISSPFVIFLPEKIFSDSDFPEYLYLPNNLKLPFKLMKSQIFPKRFMALWFIKRNFRQHERENWISPDCLYVNYPNSSFSIAVSTCDHLNGLVHYGTSRYKFFSIRCSICDRSALLVFSIINRKLKPPDKDALRHWKSSYTPKIAPHFASPVQITVKIDFIVDHNFFLTFGSNSDKIVNLIGMYLNQAALFYHILPKFTIKFSFVEIWSIEDRFTLTHSIKTTLNNLAQYTIMNRTSNYGDLTIFLTSQRFQENFDFMAIPFSICTKRSLGIIGSLDSTTDDLHISRLIVMVIREVLGLRNYDIQCTSNKLITDCDIDSYHLWSVSSSSNCLSNSDEKEISFIKDSCGNGLLDRGEECDLGHTNDSSLIPCCNQNTCLVDKNSDCVSGSCCEKCQLRSNHHICRQVKDSHCDLPEFCTGKDAECPLDIFVENGTPCEIVDKESEENKNTFSGALCFNGYCPSTDKQCQFLWGKKATRSPDACFQELNVKLMGACGQLGVSCTNEHALCGNLHCVGGVNDPLVNTTGFKHDMIIQGRNYNCKYTGDDGLVYDGTSCGVNRFCHQNKCLPFNNFEQSNCPSQNPFYGNNNEIIDEALNTNSLKKQIEILDLIDFELIGKFRDSKFTLHDNVTCAARGICQSNGHCLCKPKWYGMTCTSRNPTNFPLDHNESEVRLKTIQYYLNNLQNPRNQINISLSLYLLFSAFVIIFLATLISLLLKYIKKNRTRQRLLKTSFGKELLHNKIISTADIDATCLVDEGNNEAMKISHTSRKNKNMNKDESSSKSSRKRSSTQIKTNRSSSISRGFDSRTFLDISHDEKSGINLQNQDSNNLVKFGSMPSYRQEKLKSQIPDKEETIKVEIEETSPFSNVETINQILAPAEEILSSPQLGSLLLNSLRIKSNQPSRLTPNSSDMINVIEATYANNSIIQSNNNETVFSFRSSPQTILMANLIKSIETVTGQNPLNIIRQTTEDLENSNPIMMESSWKQPEKGILKNKNDVMNVTSFFNSSHQSDISSSKTTLQGDDQSSSTTPEKHRRHKKKNKHGKNHKKRKEKCSVDEDDFSSSSQSTVSSSSSENSLHSSSSDSEEEDEKFSVQVNLPEHRLVNQPVIMPLPMPLMKSQTPLIGLPPRGFLNNSQTILPISQKQIKNTFARSCNSSGSTSRYEELECTKSPMLRKIGVESFFHYSRNHMISPVITHKKSNSVPSDSEWEEIECTGPDCQECQHKNAQVTVNGSTLSSDDNVIKVQPISIRQKTQSTLLTNGIVETMNHTFNAPSTISSQLAASQNYRINVSVGGIVGRPLPPHPIMQSGNSIELSTKCNSGNNFVQSQQYNSSSSCSNSSLIGKRSLSQQPNLLQGPQIDQTNSLVVNNSFSPKSLPNCQSPVCMNQIFQINPALASINSESSNSQGYASQIGNNDGIPIMSNTRGSQWSSDSIDSDRLGSSGGREKHFSNRCNLPQRQNSKRLEASFLQATPIVDIDNFETYSQPPKDEDEPYSNNVYAIHGSLNTETSLDDIYIRQEDDEGVLSLDECYSSKNNQESVREFVIPPPPASSSRNKKKKSYLFSNKNVTQFPSEYQNTESLAPLDPKVEMNSTKGYSMPYEFIVPNSSKQKKHNLPFS